MELSGWKQVFMLHSDSPLEINLVYPSGNHLWTLFSIQNFYSWQGITWDDVIWQEPGSQVCFTANEGQSYIPTTTTKSCQMGKVFQKERWEDGGKKEGMKRRRKGGKKTIKVH